MNKESDNLIELVSYETKKVISVLNVDKTNKEVTIYAMEYYDKEEKKWRLKYTADKNEYDNYLIWVNTQTLSQEEKPAFRDQFL